MSGDDDTRKDPDIEPSLEGDAPRTDPPTDAADEEGERGGAEVIDLAAKRSGGGDEPDDDGEDEREEADSDDGLEDLSFDGEERPGAETPEEGLSREVLLSRFESLVFTAPEPFSVRKIARVLNVDGKVVRELAAELEEHYRDRGVILEEVSKGFQFRSHPDNAAMIRDVFKLKPLKISRPALEALAIVAYRQPLTRAEVEDIRGVDSGGVLKYLFEKELIRVIGRKEEPGRPIIYGTSKSFLELFGLKSLSDLPALHEFSDLWDEHQKIVDEEAPLSEDNGQAAPEEGAQSQQTSGEGEGATKSDGEEDLTEMAEDKLRNGDGEKEPVEGDASQATTETLKPEELEAIMNRLNSAEETMPADDPAETEEEEEAEAEAEETDD